MAVSIIRLYNFIVFQSVTAKLLINFQPCNSGINIIYYSPFQINSIPQFSGEKDIVIHMVQKFACTEKKEHNPEKTHKHKHRSRDTEGTRTNIYIKLQCSKKIGSYFRYLQFTNYRIKYASYCFHHKENHKIFIQNRKT